MDVLEKECGGTSRAYFRGIPDWYILAAFLDRVYQNPQVERELSMSLNIGQQLSVPFILIGLGLVIYAVSRPRLKLSFPNKFADEDKTDVKTKR